MIINLRQYHSPNLLQQVYTGLYSDIFTDPAEIEPMEAFAERLWSQELPTFQPLTHFFISGEDLLSPHPQIWGFVVCEAYRRSCCGIITFIAVAPQARGKGLSRQLMTQARQALKTDMDQELVALFAEMHNPRQSSGPDAIDPGIRLRIMAKLGAHWVPLRYVQPELQPGAPRGRHLLLAAFPTQENSQGVTLATAAVEQFLLDFYQGLAVPDPQQDRDYRTMVRDLRGETLVPNLAPELPTVRLV